jgi:cell division protein FtsZ
MTREKQTNLAVVVPSTKLLQIVEERINKKNKVESKTTSNVLEEITDTIINMAFSNGENDITVDFYDLKTVLSQEGLALIGIGEYKGKDAAYNALQKVIKSPLSNDLLISGAKGMLISFSISDTYSLYDIEKEMDLIYESVDPDADIIFGTSTFEEMAEDEVKVVIVATGLEKVRVI